MKDWLSVKIFVKKMSQQTEQHGKENFYFQKLQIEVALIKNDHWNYVTGSLIRPEADSMNKKNRIEKDQKVHTDIILVINPSELYNVKH